MSYKYLDEFMSFLCCGDVLHIAKMKKNISKEITEAMGIYKLLKSLLIGKPDEYVVIDLCSGNALVPLISAFMGKSHYNYAVDKKKRQREWGKVKKFSYIENDICCDEFFEWFCNLVNFWKNKNKKVIVTAVHPCGNLSKRVVELYNCSLAEYLFLMPCCIGNIDNGFNVADTINISKDLLWSICLASKCKGDITKDNNIISPKNYIISTKRK